MLSTKGKKMNLNVSIIGNQMRVNEECFILGEGVVAFVNNDFEEVLKLLEQALLSMLYQNSQSIKIPKEKTRGLHPSLNNDDFLVQTFLFYVNDFLIKLTYHYNINKRNAKKVRQFNCDKLDYDKLDYLFTISKEKRHSGQYIISESSYDNIVSRFFTIKGTPFSRGGFDFFSHDDYSTQLCFGAMDLEPTSMVWSFTSKGIKELISLVFLYDKELSKLSTKQRYFIYCKQNPSLSLQGKFHYTVNIDNLDELPSDVYERVELLKKTKPSISKQYTVKNLEEMIRLEIIEMIEDNVRINKCVNCGKYFLPTKRADEIYCNHVFKNSRTCRDFGYENKIESDKLLKAYRTAYKAQHMRMKRNSHNPKAKERFNNWCKYAKGQLALVQTGEITFDEFKESIKNNKEGNPNGNT